MRKRYFVFGPAAVLALLLLAGGWGRAAVGAAPEASRAGAPSPGCSGTWTIAPSPNVSQINNYLNSVAGTAANDVWAVGYSAASTNQTLTEHWNGTAWTIVPSPNPGNGDNSLYAVAAVASNDVWAVGYATVSGVTQTLIAHWNGTAWAVVPSPNPSPSRNNLYAVVAVAANDVWAAGYATVGSVAQTLIAHWNGSAWAVVPSPNTGAGNNGLYGLAASAANDVWTVGYYNNGSVAQTLTEHWNGTAWAAVPSPNIGAGGNSLLAVTAVAAGDVWAAGYSTGTATQTLTEHWNGTAWTIVPSANTGLGNNSLYGLAAIAGDDIWAAGYSTGTAAQTLTEHWNGTSWAVAPSPGAGTGNNSLYGLAAVAGEVWAVGYSAANYDQTLTEHYTCAPATPTATATAAGGATATPSGTPVPGTPPPPPGPLVTGPGDQQALRVDGHQVVYEDNSTGDWDIMVKNLAVPGAAPVPVYRGAGDQRAPAISGDLVVWQDNRNGTWDIYGRRLSSGPAFPIATGPGDQTHPRVSGSLVIWENTLTPGHTGIVAEDLVTGQPVTLSDPATTNLNPDVDPTLATQVVWQSTVPTLTLALPAATANWQIAGYDLATHLLSTLSTGPGDHTNPSISGASVVWVTTLTAAGAAPAANGDSDIDGVDLRGGGRTPIRVTTPVAGTHPSQPRVRDRQVAFVNEQDGNRSSAVIQSANLDTGVVLVLSARGHDARDPDIDDDGAVVWRQRSANGDFDIYGTGACLPAAFSDVPANAYFYTPVNWLTCLGAISGYGDATFRPYANTTRGQLAKIIVGAAGWAINTAGGPHFADVPASNPFYPFVETAYNQGVISGYGDGTFRPYANVTRGQLSKIVVSAQSWAPDTTGGPHFTDVPASSPFYPFVETAYNHGIISGYADGTFRVGAEATRGQIAKIVYIAVTSP